VAGSISDIHSRKLIESALVAARAEAEAALREVRVLTSALDEHSIIAIADHAGRVLSVNKGFCRITGFSSEELIGRKFVELGLLGRRPELAREITQAVSLGGAWRGEVRNERADGSVYWVDSTVVPYMSSDGKLERYVGICFEITGQKAAEAKLVYAQELAAAASQSKSEFLANMSHEIRTPMTAILGYADLLAHGGEGNVSELKRAELTSAIRRNGEHLLSIINDILDLSKIEAGKMTVESVPVSPRELVDDVLRLLSVQTEDKGLAVHVKYAPQVPDAVYTDPVRLRQILMNLLGNAIKFTPRGEVAVTVTHGGATSELQIAVRDTGVGMLPEQVSRLFGAFEQADSSTTRRFGGTGLGLRISKRLSEMLGGDIHVQSAPDQGSTFTVRIQAPACLGHSAPEAPAAQPSPPETAEAVVIRAGDVRERPLLGLRILFAEDGPDNVHLISYFLRKAGAEVVVVENGRLALEALTVGRSIDSPLLVPCPFDVLLTDMQMPEMDGYELTRLLRSKGSTLRIVALTAHAMSGDLDKCLAAGCDDYATKPVDRAHLLATCAVPFAPHTTPRARPAVDLHRYAM
jgi:PAS domain S-box-containing protein